MRTKDSFEYREDAEKNILGLVSREVPQTTNVITAKAQKKYYAKIHKDTVRRLLQKLYDEGKIRRFSIGQATVWQL